MCPHRHRIWLLDLDNTLHDAGATVFPRISEAMTAYMARELDMTLEAAAALRVSYWRRYGATLLGLVKHHGIDAAHFLHETHAMDDLHTIIRRNHALVHLLQRLPGRLVLVTNAPRDYAWRILRALGVHRLLDDVFTVESMRFAGRLQPKPSRPMFRRLIASLRVPANRCVLVEDSIENLRRARAVGLRGVLITEFVHRGGARRAVARAAGSRKLAVPVRSVTDLRRLRWEHD